MIKAFKQYLNQVTEKGVDLNSITKVFIIFTVISFACFVLISSLYLGAKFKTTVNDMLLNTRESELNTLSKNLEQFISNRVQVLSDLASKQEHIHGEFLILGEQTSINRSPVNKKINFGNKSYAIDINEPNLLTIYITSNKNTNKFQIISASFPISFEKIFGAYNPDRTSYKIENEYNRIEAENYNNFTGTEYKKYIPSIGLILNHKISETYNEAKSKKLLINLLFAVLMSSILSSILVFFIGKNMLLKPYIELNENKKLLEQKTIELEISNEELDRFAHIISHDLKEPIRGISIYADMIKRSSDTLSEENNNKLKTISELAQKSITMLTKILEHSRVGKVNLAYKEINMQELVKEILFSLKILIEEKNTEVIIPRPLPNIICDSVRSGEVFHNLIANGIKYNDKEKKLITINYEEKENGLIKFYVSDNGTGIDKKYHKKIFEIFNRITNNNEGTGVGLALVKRILEKHNGTIQVESELGEGSCFVFDFGPESIIKSKQTSAQ